ncbi:hypothetical protein [Beggiatoa leptomitoformis]|uniref:Uncharacterized protein n=1 Tax=Beggiatoa leptomitoformis TaxID=288004 RepID=A0A2N9YCL5_9GAMM|nr:hypothetical protein [Beggiatoa leptomitoformis]ALG66527.1 hypothetical protein AL038_00715 [Beggiatoa leptomitoformis]AUI68176.1 hypothetical protein BLE401_05330 [Beggiatoa leptomitoformis]
MNEDLIEKRQIILAARQAAHSGLKASANPYPVDTENYMTWQHFYTMAQNAGSMQCLYAAEYEASAY